MSRLLRRAFQRTKLISFREYNREKANRLTITGFFNAVAAATTARSNGRGDGGSGGRTNGRRR